jgi:hypothetical protein
MLDIFKILERAVENSPEEKTASCEPHQKGDDEFYERDDFEHGFTP